MTEWQPLGRIATIAGCASIGILIFVMILLSILYLEVQYVILAFIESLYYVYFTIL